MLVILYTNQKGCLIFQKNPCKLLTERFVTSCSLSINIYEKNTALSFIPILGLKPKDLITDGDEKDEHE